MKEFLTTNINGSYANMGLNGELERMYAGYLVSSLTPPRDRAVVLEWVDERIYAGSPDNCETIFEKDAGGGQTGIKTAEYSEKGGIPRSAVHTDTLDFARNIVMSRNTDAVRIAYEITNKADTPVTLQLEPWLTFRRPDSIAKPEDLHFEKIKEKNATNKSFSVTYVPRTKTYPDIPCRITLAVNAENAVLSVMPSPLTDARPRYTKDEETGKRGVKLIGACLVPYRFFAAIPARTSCMVNILCEAHREEIPEIAEEFLAKPLEDIRAAYEAEEKRALECAEYGKILEKFGNTHPETAEIYRELVLSASKFITRTSGTPYMTVMAGYPWFLDWGRDTMIALTGLLLVTGRFDTARDVLRSFARYVRHGMIPNVFPAGSAEEPQYNTVDASLWFFYAADMYVRFSGDDSFVKNELYPVLERIMALYSRSFDELQAASGDDFCYGIYMDEDGFVHAGTDAGDQLTWMDVRIAGKAVTPRHDCPVEIQALMYNALNVMLLYGPANERYSRLAKKLKTNAKIFYNPQKQCLYDYVEGTPQNRTFNDCIRPNQIWAVSLPYALFDGEMREKILSTVRTKLVTDLGLRSLAPEENGYIGKYEGDLLSRDKAYHNGTSWGFLVGHYILACLKAETPEEYLHGLLLPYLDHMQNDGCIYGIAEVFDGDSPKTGKGCYNQAWSVGCLLEAIYAMSGLDKR